MDKPLVSMITYCFNGERFVHKYFEAILAQTYPNIELIFFDNGSVDKTYEIAKAYQPKLESRGIQVQLIRYEENQPTSSLKQKGFELMHGEYFFGCDSDDLIHPTYMEEMQAYLEEHPEKGIVFCQLRTILEETGELLGIAKLTHRSKDKEAFLDMLYARNTLFTGISHMMRKSHFLKVNPEMKLHSSRYGENYQVQLPFLYHNLQGYIDKPLGDYFVRHDSYTGKLNKDPMKQIIAYRGQEENIIKTLERMNIPNKEQYYPIFQKRLREEAFAASLQQQDKALRKECYLSLKEVHGVSAKNFVAYHCPLLFRLAKKVIQRR